MAEPALRLQWKKFADEYIELANIYQAAINAGYSENYARTNASRLLEKDSIRDYIAARMAEIDSEKIADQTEVLEYLTGIMRGQQKEQSFIGVGQGEQKVTEIEVSAKDRIKAAELIGKRFGLWVDRTELTGNVGVVQIVDDIPRDAGG